MIFVTIGTQAPFNRLVRTMDEIAQDLNEEIIVQAFDLDFVPGSVKVIGLLPTAEFNELVSRADLIVSHAGMGNIISALSFSKPILVIPRLANLGEHRNDHQTSTAIKMASLGYVTSVYEMSDLKQKIHHHLFKEKLPVPPKISEFASTTLVASISDFINKSFH